MSETNNLNDVLRTSVRPTSYNALQNLGQLYRGGSNASSYVPLIDKLKSSPQQNFCVACAWAGQPCSKHLKSDAPVMSVDDLLGGVSQYAGFVPQSANIEKNVHGQQNNGVYLIVDMSNPQNYAVASAILKAVAQYYAKNEGKNSDYLKNSDSKQYIKSTYTMTSQGSAGGKK